MRRQLEALQSGANGAAVAWSAPRTNGSKLGLPPAARVERARAQPGRAVQLIRNTHIRPPK
jgi:hypothetical protein